MNDNVKESLQSYLNERNQLELNHDYIFVSNRGNKLNRTTVNKFLKTYCELFGKEITPHDFRHFFVAMHLELVLVWKRLLIKLDTQIFIQRCFILTQVEKTLLIK